MKTNFEIPIRTVSEANRRDHWAVKAKRAKEQRGLAEFYTRQRIEGLRSPTSIMLTRIGPCLLDSDNLVRSMKAVRDGIADAVGMDDGDPRLFWKYEQRKRKTREYSVMVTIEEVL